MTAGPRTPVRILGVDPGTRVAGYGVVEVLSDGKVRAIAVGAWHLDAKSTLAARLAALAVELRRVLAAYTPNIMCVELPFVSNNSRSALVLGAARGVVLAESHLAGLEIAEISATSAKKTITGNGYADKEQVRCMLQSLLHADLGSLPYDASDALAIAYAHAFRMRHLTIAGVIPELSDHRAGILKEWSEARRKRRKRVGFETLVSR